MPQPSQISSSILPQPATAAVATSADVTPLVRVWTFALLLYAIAMAWLQWGGGDLAIADALYAKEGGRWALREHWLTVAWAHQDGKRLVWVLWLGLAAFALATRRRERWRAWHRPLLMLLASVAASTLLVAVLKHAVPVDCPWHLQRYGGTLPHVGLFQARPSGMPANACFPAAHASAGYAWIALYFFFLQVRPHWRWAGLAAGLLLGGVFGIAQQLRGAHFLSHDLTTIMLCWTIALGMFRLSIRRGRA